MPRATGTARWAAWSAAVRDSARIAAWTLGLSALTSAIGTILAQHRAGSLAVQAFVVEWGAGRLGVAWSDPEAPPQSSRDLARRVGTGALLGLGAATFVLGFARMTGAMTVAAWTWPGAALVAGGAAAVFSAVRDELLLRGLVLRAFRHTLGRSSPTRQGAAAPGLLVVCGLVAAAARFAELPPGPPGLATLVTVGGAALLGGSFATLWLRDRGGWVAVGAHAVWGVATTSAVSGGLLDVRWGSGPWGGGALDASAAVAVGLAGVAAVAAVAWRRALARPTF